MIKKNFLFINVGAANNIYRVSSPPIGLAHLIGYLRQYFNWNYKIIDLKIYNKRLIDLTQEIKTYNPDYIGLTCLSVFEFILEPLIRILRKINPGSKILLGGPHVSAARSSLNTNIDIDAGIIGEGELILKELIELYENGKITNKALNKIKGIIYKEGDSWIFTGNRENILDLDSLPFPAYDMLNIEDYSSIQSMSQLPNRRYMCLFSSRACPYNCIFCHSIFGKKYRAHSPTRVVDEIEYCIKKFDIHSFEFVDDIFNFNKKRVIDICELIIKRGLKISISFPNALRGDLLDEETIHALKHAGTNLISFSPESASQKTLNFIKKNINLKKVESAIKAACKNKIFTNGYFMIGFPCEEVSDILETINFAKKSDLHSASFFMAIPYKNTLLDNIVREKYPDRQIKIKNSDTDFTYGFVNNTDIDDDTLRRLRRKAYTEFYFKSPKRLYRIARDYPVKFGYFNYIGLLIRRILYAKYNLKTSSIVVSEIVNENT